LGLFYSGPGPTRADKATAKATGPEAKSIKFGRPQRRLRRRELHHWLW